MALVCGASLTLGYAPFSIWPIVPLAVSAFLYLLSRPTTDKPFLLGWLFGLGWFGAGISWVHVSIADFGGLPLIGSVGLMLLLCGYLALYPALCGLLLRKYFAPYLWPLALPAIWLICEWLRGWMLTGFPWLSLGYSQFTSPLSGWMPVIGEFGVSGLLVMVCAAMAVWLPAKRYAATAILVMTVYTSGWVLNSYQWTTPKAQPVQMAMVQGNIKQELRWVPEQDQPTMQKYLSMTQAHWDNRVIIWPEAAVPKLEPLAKDYLQQLDALASDRNVGLITGIVNYNFETRDAYNNLITLGKKSPNDEHGHYQYFHNNRYAKHHLLPIGEFIPFEDWLRGLAPIFDLPMSSFTRGDYQQANLVANGLKFAPAICFEIVFPQQVRANIYADTDFIITVSNDAWFGNSHGPDQHMEIAQVRAKEFGTPVARATNTGITAFVDHRGHIQSQLPQFEAGVLSDAVYPVDGKTPYCKFGNTPAWLMVMLTLFGALWHRRSLHS